MNQRLSDQFPAGCYIGFNAMIDRKASEQLVSVCGDAMRNGYDAITLCLSSNGGLMDHTYYVINMLEALPIKLTTHNVGVVQSAANLAFLCGDERYAVPGSTFYFHQTSFSPPPSQPINEAYMTERLKAIQHEDDRCAAFYADKTGLPIEEVRDWHNTERVVSGDTAIKHRLIHAIKPLSIPPKAFFHQVIV